MKLGYARVSKADGSQTLDLQMDALVAAGVSPDQIYSDEASGKRDDRPGLEACLKALRRALLQSLATGARSGQLSQLSRYDFAISSRSLTN